MSQPTVIARLDEHVCVVEPASATWYVAPKGAVILDAPADGESTIIEPDASTLDEVWVYTNLDCNLTCSHCFVGDVAAARESRPSLARLKSVVDEAVGLGASTVFFTGGEPFARADLPQLLAHSARVATTGVLTNATLITSRTIARLEAAGLGGLRDRLAFQVSIDGPRAIHDAVRGPGACERALAGVRELLAWGVRPAIVTTLTADNVSAAPQVTELAAELGLGVHHLLLPHRDGRLECEAGAEAATPAEILSAIRACRAVGESSGVTISNDAVIANRVRRPGRRFDGCTGGSRMLVVGADGRIFPCPTLVGHAEFAAQTHSLADARMHEPISRFAGASLCDRSECAGCAVRHFCGGGCPAHALRAGEEGHRAEPYCEVYRGLVGDHIRSEAERLLDAVGGTALTALRPDETPCALPVRYRDACT
jgi:radical SAM protein with 4Fe4S-binding SPASM domain